MIELLELRRLCAIVRPDAAFGVAGEFAQPPKAVSRQPDWGIRVLATKSDGTIVGLADTAVPLDRVGNDYQNVSRVVRYTAAGTLKPSAKTTLLTGQSGFEQPLTQGWYDAITDSVWTTSDEPSIGRGAKMRPTAGGYNLDRIAADGSKAATLRVALSREINGDIWAFDRFQGAAISDDGGLFVIVDQTFRKHDRLQILKFRPNGTPDARWGRGGTLTLPMKKSNFYAFDGARALPGSGLQIVLDSAVNILSASGRAEVATNGDGRIVLDEVAGAPDARLIGADKNGRLLVLNDYNPANPVVTRVLPTGRIDTTFGTAGRLTLPADASGATDAIVADDGSFVLPSAVVRVTSAGAIDADWRQTAAIAGSGMTDHSSASAFKQSSAGYLDTAGHLYLYDISQQRFDGVIRTVRYAKAESGVALSSGTLTVTGTGDADRVTITRSGDTITATFNGQRKTFARTAVKRQSVLLYNGDDTFSSTLDVPITLDGGAGNDALAAGDGKADINLGGGSNTLVAGNGGGTITRDVHFHNDITDKDTVTAGRGAWTLHFGYSSVGGSKGRFNLDGGQYTLYAGQGDQVVYVDSDLPARIYTGYGNDYIVGGRGDDYISTDAGKDRIDAGAGDDRVYAGYDADLIRGGAGNDVLVGEGSGDTIYGDDGDDRIYAGYPGDYQGYNDGANFIDGGSGYNVAKLEMRKDTAVNFAKVSRG